MIILARFGLTELDTRVLLTDLLTLLVREEHVGRETTLGRVGVCTMISTCDESDCEAREKLTLLLLSTVGLSGLALGSASGLFLRHDVGSGC